jgi:hypothetical protein
MDSKDIESDLRKEIDKWTLKIEEEIKRTKLLDKNKSNFLDNINAYVSDSKYFLQKNELIKSYEALIWAFAVLETCKELKILG